MIWCKRGVRSCWNTFVRLIIIIEMCCAAGRLEVLAERHVAVPGLSSPCAGNRLVPHVQVYVSRPRMHANVVGRPRGAHPYSVRRSMAGVRVRRLLRRVIRRTELVPEEIPASAQPVHLSAGIKGWESAIGPAARKP
jgi:hypothetical protein